MGSGKNFWAKKLSDYLSVPWYDVDKEIEKNAGITISDIFRKYGEDWFRDKEASVLRNLVFSISNLPIHEQTKISAIVATGGGAPCFRNNMDWMNSNGITVWLNPPIEVLATRLEKERHTRPLIKNLKDEELRSSISDRLNVRKEFYGKSRLEIKNTDIAVSDFVNQLLHAQELS